jgi:hypothetical protein
LYLSYCLRLWYLDYHSPKYSYGPRTYENTFLLINLKIPNTNVEKFFEEVSYSYLNCADLKDIADGIKASIRYSTETKIKYTRLMYEARDRYNEENKIKVKKARFENAILNSKRK